MFKRHFQWDKKYIRFMIISQPFILEEFLLFFGLDVGKTHSLDFYSNHNIYMQLCINVTWILAIN